MTRKGDKVIRNTRQVTDGIYEGEIKPFGAYSGHIIVPGSLIGKTIRFEVINA